MSHFLVEANGGLDECSHRAAHSIAEAPLLEVSTQNAAVDCTQSLGSWEMHCKNREMPLCGEWEEVGKNGEEEREIAVFLMDYRKRPVKQQIKYSGCVVQ